jgi:biopolymer transport protein ExbD
MALKIKRQRRDAEEIPLSSTSDIAFLLIVFFLTVSALLEFKGVEIPLPKADAPPMQILKKNIYRVEVNADGQFQKDKKIYALDDLQRMIRTAHSENPDLVIVLNVHPDAPSEPVPQFIKRIQDERITKFSLSIQKGGKK